jgi:hypothetical protein
LKEKDDDLKEELGVLQETFCATVDVLKERWPLFWRIWFFFMEESCVYVWFS